MKKGQLRVFIRIGVLLLPFVVLAGCAVLTVDVDVYKGSLANQKDVQTKQLAAMTMAAKPILEGLKKQLLISIGESSSNGVIRVVSSPKADPQILSTNLSPSWVYQTLLLGNVDDILGLYDDKSKLLSQQTIANSQKIATINQAHLLLIDSLDKVQNISTNKQSAPLSSPMNNSTNATTIPLSKDAVVQAITNTLVDPKTNNLPSQINFSWDTNAVRSSVIAFARTVKRVSPESALMADDYENSASNAAPNVARALSDVATTRIENSFPGLKGGRADDGIENIISSYLNKEMGTVGTNDTTELDRKKLLMTAIDFAEKVKFIADNKNDDSQFYRYSQYLKTLEAIGNSILSMADALNERLAFERNDGLTGSLAGMSPQPTSHLAGISGITNLIGYSRLTTNANFLVQQDAIIQQLQDVQVVATLNGETNIAAHAKAAVDLVTAYRSSHIFIMPTMAYLRSSYPATSLQRNDDGLWHNMLARESWHSLPTPFGELFSNGSIEDQKDARIQQKIDKQFWQTINQVRVAGAGITSYVITKDDIGNWYVKSYKSDPSPIIEGAKSLALYSAAAPAAGAKGIPSVAKTPATNAEPILLQKEFDILTASYAAETLDAATNILQTTNIVADLKAQLGNVPFPAFTNVFTNLASLAITNPTPLLVSTNFSTSVKLSQAFTNGNPGTQVTNSISDSFSNKVALLAFGNSWTTNISISFTNGIQSGAGTAFIGSAIAKWPANSKASLLHADPAPLQTIASGSFPVTATVSNAPTTVFFTNTINITFSNAITSTFTDTNFASIIVTNYSGFTNLETSGNSTNLIPVTFFDASTNLFGLVSVFTNVIVEIVANQYICSVAYTTNGSFTNIVAWSLTNNAVVTTPADGTNIVLLSITDTFNNTNGTQTVPVAGVNLDFLEKSYKSLVYPSATNLVAALADKNASNNIPGIATSALKVLQQWDELVNKTALSGTADQNRLVLKYVAPQLRSLAKRRMDNLKDYSNGLKLLGQSQQ